MAIATPDTWKGCAHVPEILYLQFTNPTAYPPLEHGALVLQHSGWRIRFLGVRWHGSGNFSFPDSLKDGLRLIKAPSPGWRQKLFYLHFQARAVVHAMRQRPQWVYVSDPMAAPAGLLLHQLGFQVAYHEHDSPSGPARSAFDRLVLWCRRLLARRAEFNVLPQQTRCRFFQASTGTTRPVLCVWNCPRRSEVSQLPRAERPPDQPLGIYYHGSINLTRLPLALIEAAGISGVPIRLRAVGYETVGSVGASASLRQAAQRFSPSLQLELPGPMIREQLFSQMEGMHLGWIAYNEDGVDMNLRHLAGASNKAFDYLAGGLTLLVNRSCEWRELYINSGVALPCGSDDPVSMAQCLRWAYHNPRVLANMGERGRNKAQADWNYERQFKPVNDLISSLSG